MLLNAVRNHGFMWTSLHIEGHRKSSFWILWSINKVASATSKFHKYCSDYLFKLLLIGDSGVGKSCLLLRFAVRTSFYYPLIAQRWMNSLIKLQLVFLHEMFLFKSNFGNLIFRMIPIWRATLVLTCWFMVIMKFSTFRSWSYNGFVTLQKIRTVDLDSKTIKLQIVSIHCL